MIWRLAAHPEYQPILLEELQVTLSGRPFGDLTRTDLVALAKLDSFVKEAQRISPAMNLTMVRRINRAGGISLPDGTHLPQGTFIGTSSEGVMRDPAIFADPDRFDGLRFWKMRRQAGHENRHQFVSLSEYDTQFGAGSQACPGRFVVSYEIKLIVGYLLLCFDVEADVTSDESYGEFLVKPDAKVRLRRKG